VALANGEFKRHRLKRVDSKTENLCEPLRTPLRKEWAGISDVALQDETGIDDAMFCHSGLFIASAGTFRGTIKMAFIALQQ
jgi:uncharacterized UPF0160 family protein